MLLTVFETRPIGVLVCLPSYGSYWNFKNYAYLPGPPTVDCVKVFEPMPGAVPPLDVLRSAAIPEECRLPDAVPVVCLLDAQGAPTSVLPWSELTFTLGRDSANRDLTWCPRGR